MNITTDGQKVIVPQTGRTAVLVSGNLGAAFVSIGYIDEADEFTAFEGTEVVTSGSQYLIRHGTQVDPVVQTSGADGSTNYNVTASACQ